MLKNNAQQESEENKDQPIIETDLDRVHENIIDKLENENTLEEGVEDVEPNEDGEKEIEEGNEEEVSQTESGEGEENKDDSGEEKSKQPEQTSSEDVEEYKPVKYDKVKVKDSDGVVHEFDSLDEIPDDFEPETYKEWGKAVQALTEKARLEKIEEEKVNWDREDRERKNRIKEIQKEWDNEADALVKANKIPSDKEERTKIVDAVYEVMRNEMKAGRSIDSFTHAFEIYSYRNMQEETEQKRKEMIKEKKDRGSRILPGGSPSPSKPTNRGRVIEAPPSGVSLDDVHAKVLGSL